jgi:hypothetical protein
MNDNQRSENESLEPGKEQHKEFLGLINQYLDLKRWGFVESYFQVVGKDTPLIIADNPSCRVRFLFQIRDYGDYRERDVPVLYGRLHATNTGEDLPWNGKAARCWHVLWYYVLDFLDGLSPVEAVDQLNRQVAPRILEEFERSYPAWELWGDVRTRYLRKPERWDAYVRFHNEIKRLTYETERARIQAEKPFKQFDEFVPDELC